MGLSTAAKVGIVTMIGLILIGVVIVWKSEILLVGRGYELIASFDNVEGLTIGSEVRFRGSKVGKVMKIDPGPYDLKVYSVIEPSIKIPSDSTLRVAYDGIVGMKFLEIRPGTSETLYQPTQVLLGTRTAAIVDFVDIGSKNLVETKAILEAVRRLIEDPALQKSFRNAVFIAEKTAIEADRLVVELRETTQGIKEIVGDPKFQSDVKGTIRETEKTLSSANRFFDSVGNMNVRASGGVDLGTKTNTVKGNVDVVQSDKNYFRVGIGEGPTRQISLLDVLFNSKVNDRFGFRLGTINNQLGGGVAFYPSDKNTLRGDVYDINNEEVVGTTTNRLWPKVRLGYEFEWEDYMDMSLKGDDLLNAGYRNVTIGVLVKPPGERIY